MLIKKAWRTMGLYKAQFISMIVMITIGIGAFAGFNIEWLSIEKNTSRFREESGFADFRLISEKGFGPEAAEKAGQIEGISRAALYASFPCELPEIEGRSLGLSITKDPKVSSFLLEEGAPYDPEDKEGIWLSQKFAAANQIKVGNRLKLSSRGFVFEAAVRGLISSAEYLICVRDRSQLMPDYTRYGFAYISPALYEKALGFPYYPEIHLLSPLGSEEAQKRCREKLGGDFLFLEKENIGSYAQAASEVEEGKVMASVLPVLFLLVAVLTMVTTLHRLTLKEKLQIGTLKALGFKDRQILLHYSSFAFLTALIGFALGSLLGFGVAYLLFNRDSMMGTYFDMPYWDLFFPPFALGIMALIFLSLLLVSYFSLRGILRQNPAESLRPYVPPRIRALRVERLKLFHRLSFVPRWNLRDTMLHKSRTAMSLFGVIGCSMIIIAALGIDNTVRHFIDIQYRQAILYRSRIFLKKDAKDDAVRALSEACGGDRSASLTADIGGKMLSLEIYELGQKLVRFPDENNRVRDLEDGGLYLSMRTADELGLKAGDKLQFKLLGEAKTYSAEVQGFVRSLSEGLVMSRAAAEKAGLTFVPDSIYSRLEKAEVPASEALKSITSKQDIMDSFDTFIDIMQSMIRTFIIFGIILGIFVLYNLGVMSYTERCRELATLKVIGFKDRQISKIILSQNVMTAVAGSLLGLPLGIGALKVLIEKLGSDYELLMYVRPASFLWALLLTYAVSMLTSFMLARQNRHIDMAEALKCPD